MNTSFWFLVRTAGENESEKVGICTEKDAD